MGRVRMFGEGPYAHRVAVGVWLCSVMMFGPHAVAAQTLKVSGSPTAMKITTAIAGAAPTAATNAVTTYTTKTLLGAKQITAQLNSNMPPGMTLQVQFAAVTGATSAGVVTLSTTPQTVVSNITNIVNKTAAITYTVSATPVAGVVLSSTRTVTLTLAAFP
jgi:hypothetical protein